MLERFKQRAREAAEAIAAGEAVETGEAPGDASAFPGPQTFSPYVLVYAYDATSVTVRRYDSLGPQDPELVAGKVNWVRVVGVHDEAFVRGLCQRFGLHPLLVDDVLGTGNRPEIEEYDAGVFVLLRLLDYDAERKRVLADQVSLLAGEGFVLTFQAREANVWDALAQRLEKGGGRLAKRGGEHLTHALVAAVLDEYILTLGRLAEDIEELEQTILSGGGSDALTETYALKREVLFLHRSLWPLREVLGRYLADASNTAEPGLALLWNDIRQDVYQVLDGVETLREMLAEMVGLAMTKAELRMNAVGQYLTLVATIFLPLNFLVGFFGMNFDNLPLKSEAWGIYVLIAVMALTIVAMAAYFYRKHWIANTKVE